MGRWDSCPKEFTSGIPGGVRKKQMSTGLNSSPRGAAKQKHVQNATTAVSIAVVTRSSHHHHFLLFWLWFSWFRSHQDTGLPVKIKETPKCFFNTPHRFGTFTKSFWRLDAAQPFSFQCWWQQSSRWKPSLNFKASSEHAHNLSAYRQFPSRTQLCSKNSRCKSAT